MGKMISTNKNFSSLISSRYSRFYENVIDKYLNFKNKSKKTSLLFKVELKSFEKESIFVKNELKKVEKKIINNLIEKNFFFIYNPFKHSFSLRFYINLDKKSKIFKNFYNQIKKEQNRYFLINKIPSENKVYVVAENKLNFINPKNFSYDEKKNQLLSISFAENCINQISVYKSLKTKDIQSLNLTQKYIQHAFEAENITTKNHIKTLIKGMNSYLSANIKNLESKTYKKENVTKNIFKNQNVEIKEQKEMSKHLNLTFFKPTSVINQKGISTVFKNFTKGKSEFIEITEKKVKISRNIIYKKEKNENLEIKKETNLKKLQKDVEKIKTQILIRKSEEINEKEETNNLLENKNLIKKKYKNQLAEEIYEIVLKKWEKDLIKRGLLNG